MKIALISHSDLRGGAAMVTFRLMNTLRVLGHDARMLVFVKESDSEFVEEVGCKPLRLGAKVAERAEIFLHNGFSRRNLFKVSTASTGCGVTRNRFYREADAIILGWVNQGLMSLDDIAAITKPAVWIMHDMWCMTGICHHAGTCDGYMQECGECPFLGRRKSPDDLSHKILTRKKRIYSESGIKFVAVSSWLAAKAAGSTLLRDKEIHVVPNPFPVEEYEYAGTDSARRLIVMGAARLDDDIKNLPAAIEALNILADEHPETTRTHEAVFFGGLRDKTILDKLKFPHRWIGKQSQEALKNLYRKADIVLSSSRFETLPGTLIEGMAAGAVPVTTGNGGQRDIVTHLKTGYIADDTPADLANGIYWGITSGIQREAQHKEIERRFSGQRVAERILTLYQHRSAFVQPIVKKQ